MNIPFIKMEGIGNDYIYIDAMKKKYEIPQNLIPRMCHRRKGIGADGVVLIQTSEKADAKMTMFNADASEAENCGNAIRCVAAYLYHNGLQKNPLFIESKHATHRLELCVDDKNCIQYVKVDMGKPSLLTQDITKNLNEESYINTDFQFGTYKINGTLISMGNPHFITYVNNIETINITTLGPLIEKDTRFSEGINVEFIQVISQHKILQRTWERGTGETWACGTGACAACVASSLNKKTKNVIEVVLKGGILNIEWHNKQNLFMSGPATETFRGEIIL